MVRDGLGSSRPFDLIFMDVQVCLPSPTSRPFYAN